MKKKNFLLLAVLLTAVILSVIVALLSGEYPLAAADIWAVLSGSSTLASHSEVLYKLRLPRIILGLTIGGALSLCGTILQGIFRNPLVEPYTLGISGGASLAICLVIVLKITLLPAVVMLPLAGFSGALVTVLLVYVLTMRKAFFNINNLLLTGVMISFIASSLVMFLMSVAGKDNLHSIIFWIMGWLDTSQPLLIYIVAAASVTGLALGYFYMLDLNALSLGEEEAFHLGINIERTKKILFLTASLLTGLCVAVAGIIGFVGLVIPHFVRLFTGNDHRILLIASYLGGAVFLLNCDTLARTIIAPRQLPVGVITGIIGGLIFIYAVSGKKIEL
ncbi:MAG TPA: iron ABC transporter permease [Spirochaetota bacterium]|nr:iron ABC transporter permease [Spirochaetota bacterium]